MSDNKPRQPLPGTTPTGAPHSGTGKFESGASDTAQSAAGQLGTGQEAQRASQPTNVVKLPPAPKRSRKGWWLAGWIVSAAVVVALCMVISYFSPLLGVKKITTTGNHLLPEAAVLKKLQPLKGKPLPQITDEEVAKLLAGESAISASRIQVKLPDTLIVHLIEFDPVVIVKSGQGEQSSYALYNSLGQSIKTLKGAAELKKHRLPIVDSAQATKDKTLFTTVTKVLGDVDAGLRAQLSSVEASTVDSVTLKLKDGRRVLWGNAEQSAKKRAVLETLLKNEKHQQKLAQQGKKTDYVPAKIFDVSTPDQPVLR